MPSKPVPPNAPYVSPTKYTITTSRNFAEWLALVNSSIAFTSYQSSRIFFIGINRQRSTTVFERMLARCMGLGVTEDGRSLIVAMQNQLLRFDNVVSLGSADGEHDAVFSPHVAWITGDVDTHDVAFLPNRRPVFVNTLYSCIATVSDGYSFRPLWRPPFISALAPEDRCHLNGLALEDDRPRYVTLFANSDVADGWRDRRADGGTLMDISTNEVMLQGLSMPHSPRVHDGRLWLLNSGTGYLGFFDPVKREFQPVAFCPGYARGLAFVSHYAVVGLSLAREAGSFQALPLDEALASRGAQPRCGLSVIDTKTGHAVAWLRIDGAISELFDVAIVRGVRNPGAVGFMTDQIERTITIDDRPDMD